MKEPTHSSRRRRVRIKPGRFINLPPYVIRRARWKPDDILCLTVANGGISFARLPSEVAWRIDRLRLRTGSTASVASVSPTIRTYADYVRLKRCKGERTQRTDDQNRTVEAP